MDPKILKRQMFGYFQSVGFYEYRRGFMKGDCPECGAEDKAGMNLERNFFHCFRCEYVSSPLKVIMRSNGMDRYAEVYQFLAGYDHANYKPPVVEAIPEKPIVLPDGFKLLKYGKNRIGRMARNYMIGRGFDIKEISRKGVGYVGKGSSEYFGYIIFPYYRNRKIVYFQTRLFFGLGPKFKNPKYEDYGIGKNQVLYNEAALQRYKEVHIVESNTNALTLGNHGVGMNGKVVSPWQLSQFLKSPVELFNIMLDKDAWEFAIDLASEIIMYKPVRVIEFEDDRDINDLGRETSLKMIGESPILYNINDILKLRWK